MSKSILLQISDFNFGWNLGSPSESLLLKGLSLELMAGQFLMLIGANGSGKSTLLKILSGIISPKGRNGSVDLNAIQYLDQSLFRLSQQERARIIAYVSSDAKSEFPMSAEEVVALGRICHRTRFLKSLSHDESEKVEKAMVACRCWDLRKRDFSSLSGGEKQRVALASALAQSPKILILDEALSKMDLHHQAEMCQMLQSETKRGLAIVLVSHDLNLALEWVDSVFILHQGKRVGQGMPKEMVTRGRLELLYPGGRWTVGVNPVTGAVHVFFG